MSAGAASRFAALEAAVAALEEVEPDLPGSTPEDLTLRARDVLERASRRRELGAARTAVALAGATGTGKSSLFNALLGGEHASVGVRRPTTSAPVAGVVGEDGEAAALLDWLGVENRVLLEPRGTAAGLDGLVLLDLPDVDSVELEHGRSVDRLAEVVDVFVWVVDPEKYADNLLHRRYLRPMATHAEVTLVALNRFDILKEADRALVVADLRRLLAEDGLPGVPVLATCARTGEGVAQLRERLATIVRGRAAAEARLEADAQAAGRALLACYDSEPPPGVGSAQRRVLTSAIAEAAGVDAVAEAVGASYRMRARSQTGWPPTRWLARLRPDPLRRLGLVRADADPDLTRSSRPGPTPVQRARVASAVRRLGHAAGEGASEPWRTAIRAAAAAAAEDLTDALDRAIVATPLAEPAPPRWWAAGRAAQRLLLVTALAGLAWLAVLAAVGYLQLPELPLPHLGTVPWPTALTLGGALAGVLLALLARLLAGVGAARRARTARRRLAEAVTGVADVVVLPVDGAVERCRRVVAAARQAAAD